MRLRKNGDPPALQRCAHMTEQELVHSVTLRLRVHRERGDTPDPEVLQTRDELIRRLKMGHAKGAISPEGAAFLMQMAAEGLDVVELLSEAGDREDERQP